MARTTAARPICSTRPVTPCRSDPVTETSSGATDARNPSRRLATRSPASCWGPHPTRGQPRHGHQAPAESRSASASTISSSSGRSSSTVSEAATWSRIDRASRAEPRPRRTAMSMPRHPRPGGRPGATWPSSSPRVSAPSRRNSKCWVRLRMVASTFCGSVVANTKTTWAEAPRGSSAVHSSRRREHVDLVDDVDLLSTRSPQGGPGHQVPHGVHPVVGGGGQLMDVERRPPLISTHDGHTPHGSPSSEIGTVERLRQDPRRRRLPSPGAR